MTPISLPDAKKHLKNYPGLQHIPYNEHVWGHRFKSDQTPALILFELMCVLDNQFAAKNKGAHSDETFKVFHPDNKSLAYGHRRNLRLRYLLFQNEILEELNSSNLSDKVKWDKQRNFLLNADLDKYGFDSHSINHMSENFPVFEDFFNAIEALRQLTFDPLSKKRWTSKFLYPISMAFIWNDLGENKFDHDRRFFARGGELAYLMLCRASVDLRNKLEEIWGDWFGTTPQDPFSKIAEKLVKLEDFSNTQQLRAIPLGFLPYKEMPLFNHFARDIISVFSNDKIDDLDKINTLSNLVGFYIGSYIYHVAYSDANKEIAFLTEVIVKPSNSIRKASIESVSTQRNQLKYMLEKHLPILEASYKSDDPTISSDEKVDAIKYFQKNISIIPNMCFRHIGLLSKKNTRSYRYVMTESFLQTLVITILADKERMELGLFLRALEDRYFIYINRQPSSTSSVDQGDLNKNLKNFTYLLYQMGMLRHLSDACSYVINPYREAII